MSVRKAAVAGRFYEDSSQACTAQIEEMLSARPMPDDLPERIVAGVVPHAGWVFSGDLTAMVLAALKRRQEVDTFVIFGAVHSVSARVGLLYDSGRWATPLGQVAVDEELASAILDQQCQLIRAEPTAHSREHSIEVQVPIIRYLFEKARIVPLMVPPIIGADEIGRVVGQAAAASDKNVVCLGSTDLTHYGPSYYYTPMGTGPEAITWAKKTNDQHFIDLALTMQADTLISSAQTYQNACGAGAVAATVAAAKQLGAEKRPSARTHHQRRSNGKSIR